MPKWSIQSTSPASAPSSDSFGSGSIPGTNVTGSHSGHWSWQLSGSLDQQITNVPNGTYTLSVWAKGSTGTLYAKGFGGTDLSTSLTAGTSWTKVSLTGITVSNGTCDVGISSGSGNVDDFTLVKN